MTFDPTFLLEALAVGGFCFALLYVIHERPR